MTSRPLRARLGPAAAGAAAGATIWVSQGALGLVDGASLMRVGALPSGEWLAASSLAGAAAGALLPVAPRALLPLLLLALLWLPWLPVRVPGVFLLWEGPIEAVVWTAAAGGVLWFARPLGTATRLARWLTPGRAPIVAALLPALVFGAAWTVARSRVPAGDEPHYLVITQSLLRDHDLRIENNHREDQYLEYFDGALRPDFMRRGTDGQIYSIHAPGVAVLVAPAFALAGYPGAVAVVILAMSLALALVWRAAYLLTGSAAAAWAGWFAVATSAPIALHGFMIYPDTVGAAAVMCGVLALVWLDVAPGRIRAPTTWAGIGVALAWLPWLHTRFALVAGVLGLAIALRLARRPGGRASLSAFFAAPAAAAAAWFAYFWSIYGTPDPSAPYGARLEGGLTFIPAGLAGLLADQQFGLAANAPVLLVALAAFLPLLRQRRRLGLELMAVIVPYLLTVATYPMWWGGYSPPARFAVVVLPILALPLATWWAAGTRATRGVITTLAIVSAAITFGLVWVERGVFIHNGRDGYDQLLGWLSQTVDLSLAAPSVHRDGAAVALVDFAVWVAAACLLAAGWAWLSARGAARASTRALGVAAVPVAVMLAVPVVWAGRNREVLTPSTSQMAFLERWLPDRLPLAVQLTPSRVLDATAVPRRLNLGTSRRGPRRPGPEPLLQIPEVPAGEYDLYVEGRTPLSGVLTVRLGRQDVPMESWRLDGRAPGFPGLVLRLPVPAHSITITGDDEAREGLRVVTLKPRVVQFGAGDVALRAARYGGAVVFALDDNAYLEPDALWVRGERTTRLVVRADDGAASVLALRAGPVANQVAVASGGWRLRMDLEAGGTREVRLPPEALDPAVVSISSATGFRPSAYGPDSRDVRWLGVYVSWPEQPR